MLGFVEKALDRLRGCMKGSSMVASPPHLEHLIHIDENVRAQLICNYTMLNALNAHTDFLMRDQWLQSIAIARNPLNRFGAKYFSQADEDGLTLEITKRIGLTKGVFAEFGVGNGTENNTLILLAGGWRGVWIGGEDVCFDHTINPARFKFLKSWITTDNIVDNLTLGLASVNADGPDVMSIDLDGNDIYILEAVMTAGFFPKIIIVEYNAKFPPPINWKIEYNPDHKWAGDDYFGASLASFCDLMLKFGYGLVCCNAVTGANAYFVQNQYMPLFSDVPSNIEDIFVEPRYRVYTRYAHPAASQTIECMLRQ